MFGACKHCRDLIFNLMCNISMFNTSEHCFMLCVAELPARLFSRYLPAHCSFRWSVGVLTDQQRAVVHFSHKCFLFQASLCATLVSVPEMRGCETDPRCRWKQLMRVCSWTGSGLKKGQLRQLRLHIVLSKWSSCSLLYFRFKMRICAWSQCGWSVGCTNLPCMETVRKS